MHERTAWGRGYDVGFMAAVARMVGALDRAMDLCEADICPSCRGLEKALEIIHEEVHEAADGH
jgi:hypothetical protein